jgi:hypothetical protein
VILLPGKPQERVDIFRRIAPLSPIKSDARDKDVFRFVPTAGTHVLLYYALCHPTIVPSG